MVIEREKHIENLIALRNVCKDNGTFSLAHEVEQSLDYAISSLKTDLKYDLMYEGEEIYTKADMVAMLTELKYELYHSLCHEIHGKEEEDCPCTNQTTSCLATFRVCDANSAIYKVIQQKIDKLKGNAEPTECYHSRNIKAYADDRGISVNQAEKELLKEMN